jgi:hypothetical protein
MVIGLLCRLLPIINIRVGIGIGRLRRLLSIINIGCGIRIMIRTCLIVVVRMMGITVELMSHTLTACIVINCFLKIILTLLMHGAATAFDTT